MHGVALPGLVSAISTHLAVIWTLPKLEYFYSEQRGFMWCLGELRNDLAHKPENTRFTFQWWLSDEGRRQKCAKDFQKVWKPTAGGGGKARSRDVLSTDNPKLTIWFGLVYIIAFGHLYVASAKIRDSYREAIIDQLEGYKNVTERLDAALPDAQAPSESADADKDPKPPDSE